MTRADHACGTDRIAEVVEGIGGDDADVILNVQGDEPEIEPGFLDRLIERLERDRECPVATLACPFSAEADPKDPNCVKVVLNRDERALYFSRALIPYPRDRRTDSGQSIWLLHLGVYAYRRDFLLAYAGWEPCELEQIERLEQLRVLDRGYPFAVEVVSHSAAPVSTRRKIMPNSFPAGGDEARNHKGRVGKGFRPRDSRMTAAERDAGGAVPRVDGTGRGRMPRPVDQDPKPEPPLSRCAQAHR